MCCCFKCYIYVLPVVEQDVWSPHLVCGETEVFHSGMLALVPLKVVVEPALKDTDTDTVCISVDCGGNILHLHCLF